MSRADWEGTFPKERAAASREAGAAALEAINNTSNGLVDTAEDIAVVDHGLKIEDMKGLAYDDPKWNDFLEQIPVSEMVNLVSNGGWATQEVPSVGKLGYTEVDGPNGVNNIMAGSTGNQFCAQSVLACSWNTELAYDMGKTFAQEAIAMKIAALYLLFAIPYRSLPTQKIQEGLDAAAQLLYLSGSYALQVAGIVYGKDAPGIRHTVNKDGRLPCGIIPMMASTCLLIRWR